jgi:DNA-binding transcriptional regulator GbsR (MarR family)
MRLTPTAERFVLHWGEMGARWGVNRTVAQIHALLFLEGRPMHAEEIAETLAVARSNVSTSLRELQGWKLIRLVHLPGDRRDHFETATDVWELTRTVVRERQAREITPTMEVLRALLADPAISREPAAAKRRIKETLELLETLTAWGDEMLRLDTDTLTKVLRLGARIKKLMGREVLPAAGPDASNEASEAGAAPGPAPAAGGAKPADDAAATAAHLLSP